MTSTRTRTVGINQAGRDLVVGDVHGCFYTLDRALRKINFDPALDRLFGVGDLVNRGPHSKDAIEWLETRFCGVTLGNHERAVRDWFGSPNRTRAQGMMRWLNEVPRSDYRRWWKALSALPLALTIETRHGSVGIMHAETPSRVWRDAIVLLDTGSHSASDIALLGFEEKTDEERARTRPVEGVRAFVHGHFIVTEVERTANRWNIDTGAGFPNGRLSLLEVNATEFRAWTIDVRE